MVISEGVPFLLQVLLFFIFIFFLLFGTTKVLLRSERSGILLGFRIHVVEEHSAGLVSMVRVRIFKQQAGREQARLRSSVNIQQQQQQ